MSVILETQKAVYAVLTGDATLMAMVQGVYDHVPQSANYPYVTIGDFRAADESNREAAGYQLDLSINVHSASAGRKEVLDIMERIRVLLDKQDMDVTGFVHIMTGFSALSTSLAAGNGTDGVVSGVISFKLKLRA